MRRFRLKRIQTPEDPPLAVKGGIELKKYVVIAILMPVLMALAVPTDEGHGGTREVNANQPAPKLTIIAGDTPGPSTISLTIAQSSTPAKIGGTTSPIQQGTNTSPAKTGGSRSPAKTSENSSPVQKSTNTSPVQKNENSTPVQKSNRSALGD